MSDIADLAKQVKEAREAIATAEAARQATIDELKKAVGVNGASVTDIEAKLTRISTDMAASVTKLQSLEETINTLSKKVNRPTAEHTEDQEAERKHAIGLLEFKHHARVPKKDVEHPFA